jgi:hypothetical protein
MLLFFEAITENLLSSAIGKFLHYSLPRLRYLGCTIIRPSADIRIVFSALLRISESDEYLLIRNLHRPETFAPIGGVYKYRQDAQPELDKFEFRPHDMGPGDDMANDIRGYLPRRNLVKLLHWYHCNANRESDKECLRRELKEELDEIGLSRNFKCPEDFHFRSVRTIIEGPESVPGQTYAQFRIFEIYEIAPVTSNIKRFLHQLRKSAIKNPDLLLVSAQEIITGRARTGEIVASTAAYLIGKKRIHQSSPIFVSQPKVKSRKA